MKLFLVALAVAAVAAGGAEAAAASRAQSFDDCALQAHLRDILALVDTDAVAALLLRSLEDPDMQSVFSYLLGPDFRALYLDVASQQDVIEFLQYLEANCVNVRAAAELVRDFLELPAPEWRSGAAPLRNGATAFWAELLALLPLAEMRALAAEKYETYAEFRELVELIRSERTRELFTQLQSNTSYQHMVSSLAQLGIDISAIRHALGDVLGWL